jgi:hypothetical protein
MVAPGELNHIARPQLAQYVCGDKGEHTGKQHNVDDDFDHHTPPKAYV